MTAVRVFISDVVNHTERRLRGRPGQGHHDHPALGIDGTRLSEPGRPISSLCLRRSQVPTERAFPHCLSPCTSSTAGGWRRDDNINERNDVDR
jgi:hypothetical protein